MATSSNGRKVIALIAANGDGSASAAISRAVRRELNDISSDYAIYVLQNVPLQMPPASQLAREAAGKHGEAAQEFGSDEELVSCLMGGPDEVWLVNGPAQSKVESEFSAAVEYAKGLKLNVMEKRVHA